jgi:ClpP class serine protease
MLNPVDHEIKKILRERLRKIEKVLNSDAIIFYAPIDDGLIHHVNELLKSISTNERNEKLTVILTTGGGSAIAAERLVNIFRKFYQTVDFLIPDYAYSAGTILCLSGDNIFMNYNSVLGPIDPQVRSKDGHWVATLGYLDKIKN